MGKKFITGLEKGFQKSYYGKDKTDIKGNRAERRDSAQSWITLLNTKYSDACKKSLKDTRIIDSNIETLSDKLDSYCGGDTKVRVFKVGVTDAIKAAVSHSDGKRVCVLNFASHSNPGGGFIKGSRAQEEALCHVSALYPVLSDKKFVSFYKNSYGEEAYSRTCIYSKDMLFVLGRKEYHVDVLTMAAVNQGNAKNWKDPVGAMDKCMEFAYLIPALYGVEILLLGAWGCGVFGNNPETIAQKWKELQVKYKGLYREITHPVLDVNTYRVFKDLMSAY